MTVTPFPGQRATHIDLGRAWVPQRVSDILEMPPPPEWIWDGRVMRGTVTLLGGEAKIGKSMLMQQLLSCCAMGLPFLGRHTERVRCFGYFCEDPGNWLITRQFTINDHLGILMPDFDDRYCWRSMVGEDCTLARYEFGKMTLTGEWDKLWRVCDQEEAEIICIDTARTVFGGNELRDGQVTPFLRALQAKAVDGNRAIILAAHPPTGNVSKGYAGTGAWLASARAGLSLERPQGYDPLTDTPTATRVLRGLGANYAAGRSIDRVRFDHGVFVSDDNEQPPSRPNSDAARRVMDQEMLNGLYRSRSNGARVPADWAAPGSMHKRYRATFDHNTALNDLNQSFERLLAMREIVRVRVRGECLVRPTNAAPYAEEEPWKI